ncbi:MAG: AAA family ATPase [bacterium]
MYVNRIMDICDTVKKKSCFLFGARQTGKTSLISHQLNKYKVYNLLDNEIFLSLSGNPKRLEQEIQKQDKIIIIDEIQKLPGLLDEVHLIIEKYGINFLLTGSSARKLRRGGVNLLGGRARVRYLYPFIYKELNEKFSLLKALNYGLIPSVYLSGEPEEDIASYAGIYLKEEIAAEGLTRNISAFSRFLTVAALCNGQLLNYAKISNDAQVPSSTVQEYFQILRDTLIGFDVKAWKKSIKRKPISTSKFYFFDTGIVRSLQNRAPIKEKSPEIGYFFETYMAHELNAFVNYNKPGELCYWRSKSGYEVDFIINDSIAVEIKAKEIITGSDIRGLKALAEEEKLKRYIIVCFEKRARTIGKIEILPWETFLNKLWAKSFK